MSYEGLYDFLLFCFNVDFNFRLHRVIGNHQQTQMTALLAYILLHYRYPQAGAFTRLQYTLLEVNSTAGWNTWSLFICKGERPVLVMVIS